ncbi:hypothetical protein QWY75_13620 [Pontixanthobacter aestiaquae]|uniref:Uncharacterized protein n=1 Tax=Pontixanthobacter aestiaquae TaxID=1509367 RepID=A0A844Z790_9SPHN|nr:hypothetical protein [Pontixanthobacter aestiaquae]MDN3647245.1 hypothetical protein [Pontixanthobacter aestiaquae]MXO81779.1 hypothetical protein [Pontixanthobacter aestiaquae]
MSLSGSMIALAAMVPAALNPSLVVEEKALIAQICGSGESAVIRLGPPDLPATVPAMCCAKGCHGKREHKPEKV